MTVKAKLFVGLLGLAAAFCMSVSAPLSTPALAAEECSFDGTKPTMPDPETATAEDRKATVEAILAYQEALGAYRECLDKIIKNTELEKEERQGALDSYNKSVDDETAVVESWRKFDAAYKKKNPGEE